MSRIADEAQMLMLSSVTCSHTSSHKNEINKAGASIWDQIRVRKIFPNRALRSQTAGLLVVPRVSKSGMGGRAFSYQAPLLWNKLPVNVGEADTLSTLKIGLKPF